MNYEIKKYFKGGSTTYYASKNKNMKRNCWNYQLQEWGEQTLGGRCYGYNIKVKPVSSIPKNIQKYRYLKFNKEYLVINKGSL